MKSRNFLILGGLSAALLLGGLVGYFLASPLSGEYGDVSGEAVEALKNNPAVESFVGSAVVSGTVTAVGADQMTIQRQGGDALLVHIESWTTFYDASVVDLNKEVMNPSQLSFSDFSVGDEVRAYVNVGAEETVATNLDRL